MTVVPGGTSLPAAGEVETTVPFGLSESTEPDATLACRSAALSGAVAALTVRPWRWGTSVVSPKSRDGVGKPGAGSPARACLMEFCQIPPGMPAPYTP